MKNKENKNNKDNKPEEKKPIENIDDLNLTDEVKKEEPKNDKPIEVVDELPEDKDDEISIGIEGVKISNEAIATYAGIAIAEVPGVYGMDSTFVEALRGRKNLTKGIKVEADEKTAKIDVNIIVEYGARIPEVAFEIQSRVKKSVEAMTGLNVLEVNVHVNGVQRPSKS
jgi:uncharacterized alkaline shock family protein YloU